MRFGESLEHRLIETSKKELGCVVDFDPKPLAVKNVIRGSNPSLEHPNERGHNIAIVFNCRLPKNYEIDNGNKTENDNGFLKWFDKLPSDFLKIQLVFGDILERWIQ